MNSFVSLLKICTPIVINRVICKFRNSASTWFTFKPIGAHWKILDNVNRIWCAERTSSPSLRPRSIFKCGIDKCNFANFGKFIQTIKVAFKTCHKKSRFLDITVKSKPYLSVDILPIQPCAPHNFVVISQILPFLRGILAVNILVRHKKVVMQVVNYISWDDQNSLAVDILVIFES